MLFVCYPKCSTCMKAKKYLEALGAEYDFRDIKLENPTAAEIKEWKEKADIEMKKFFNTSGLLYKSMKLKDKLPAMSEDEMAELLATDGMLVKRPILVTDKTVLLGFKEKEWEAALK